MSGFGLRKTDKVGLGEISTELETQLCSQSDCPFHGEVLLHARGREGEKGCLILQMETIFARAGGAHEAGSHGAGFTLCMFLA
jgi:hypothetical protein